MSFEERREKTGEEGREGGEGKERLTLSVAEESIQPQRRQKSY